MTTRQTMLERIARAGLLAGLASSASACLSAEKADEPPVAVITANVGNQALTIVAQQVKSSLLKVDGTAGSFTLDGSLSADPEGGPLTYAWWDTSVPREVRFPTVMPVAGAPAPPVDTSKLPPGPDSQQPTFTVQVGSGKHIYSLYVTDSAGNISIPASIQITVP